MLVAFNSSSEVVTKYIPLYAQLHAFVVLGLWLLADDIVTSQPIQCCCLGDNVWVFWSGNLADDFTGMTRPVCEFSRGLLRVFNADKFLFLKNSRI